MTRFQLAGSRRRRIQIRLTKRRKKDMSNQNRGFHVTSMDTVSDRRIIAIISNSGESISS